MKYFLTFFSPLLVLGQFIFGRVALAANNADTYYGVNDLVQQGVRLGNRDLVTSVAGLINVALGFLGVVAVIIILYGGFIWMTSKGAPDKIQKAKLIIISAVIGLAIILSAYAISRFVVQSLYNGINVGGGGPGGPGGSGSDPCPEPANANDLLICTVGPTSGGAGTWVTITGWNFGIYDVANSYVEFFSGVLPPVRAEIVMCTNNAPSWGPNGNKWKVVVQVPDVTAAGQPVPGDYNIRVGNIALNRLDEWPDLGPNFHIDNSVPGPGICDITPNSGPRNTVGVTIDGVRLGGAAGDQILMDITPTTVGDPNITSWSDSQIVFDLKNDAISGFVKVKANGVDSNAEYFTVTCADPGDCDSGCCVSNSCRAAAVCATSSTGPHIDSLDPDKGTVGNMITIYGSNFGIALGSVYFSDGDGNPILAGIPNHPQCVNDYWHDNYIIVKVPVGTADGQVNLTTAANVDSNAVPFNEDGIIRPGLCKVDPLTGLFGTAVSLSGNNFNPGPPGDDILFGGISGDNNNVVNAIDATTDVPNLQGGTVAMQVKDNGSNEKSNSLPFTVQTVGGGLPVINSILPDDDPPPGQYVTIMGARFGNQQGRVTFNAVNGDFTFPPQCRDSIWRSDRIIVKIPAGVNNLQQVRVIRAPDNAVSQPYNFTVNNANALIPGLCAIVPDNGPINTEVNFYGDNFGNIQPSVKFYENKLAVPPFSWWNGQQIGEAKVPLGAQTGATVVVNNSTNKESNPINFRVGDCPNDQWCVQNAGLDHCCEGNAGKYCANSCQPVPNQCEYPWTFRTEPEPFRLRYNYCGEPGLSYQTPTPWPDGESGYSSLDSYVGTKVVIHFTRDVADIDLLDENNFQVIKCNPGGGAAHNPFDNAACAGGSVPHDPFDPADIVNNNTDEEGMAFSPNPGLEPDTWYRVDLGGGNKFHAAVGGDVWPNPPGEPAPAWHFKTRVASDACVPTQVYMGPNNCTTLKGRTTNLSAWLTDDSCNICGGNYNWTWVKTIDPSLNPPANTVLPANNNFTPRGSSVLTGGSKTDPNNLEIKVTASDQNNTFVPLAGTKQCKITVKPLQILGFGPQCDGACSNADIYVQFNQRLLFTDTIWPDNQVRFKLEDLTVPGPNITATTMGDEHVLIFPFPGKIVLGHRYKATVSGIVSSEDGAQLGADKSWEFTIAQPPACSVTGAMISPASYLSTMLMEDVPYSLIATNNQNLNCGIQQIHCTNCSYSWQSDNVAVVFVPNVNLDVNPVKSTGVGRTKVRGIITQNALNRSAESDFEVALPGSFDFSIQRFSPPIGPGACMNAAVTIEFSSPVTADSVRNSTVVYEQADNFAAGCIPDNLVTPGKWWCEFPGTFSVQDLDLPPLMAMEAPHQDLDSKVTFHPNNMMRGDTNYAVLVKGTIRSKELGGIFRLGALPQINLDGGPIDGYGWNFKTGSNICQISFTLVEPSTDRFTCSFNDCPGDIDIATAGNQHQYKVTPYDVSGTELDPAFIDTIAWTSSNPANLAITGAANNDTVLAGPSAGSTFNGNETLAVHVEGTQVGAGNGSARINMFMCARPWPVPVGPTWTPWQDGLAATDYHFETFYCMAQTATSPVLPELPYFWSFRRQPPNTSDPNILQENIFFVDPPATALNNQNAAPLALGTLARNTGDQSQQTSWWKKISSLFRPERVEGAAGPGPAPTNFAYSLVGTGPSAQLKLTWNGVSTLGYVVQRKLPTDLNWTDRANLGPGVFEFIDVDPNGIHTGDTYNYRVGAAYPTQYVFTGIITVSNFNTNLTTQDIIGIRVMTNPTQMSITDWYNRIAPNSGNAGAVTEVDGYEALTIGGTTYIAGTNVLNAGVGDLYTNIYVIAHNIGARQATIDIYNQLIDNIRFNTNLTQNNNNICSLDNSVNCTEDSECLINEGRDYVGPCQSQGLKLRRDMKRLGHMLEIQNLMVDYGRNNKICNDPTAQSCLQDSDCQGACVNSYPTLSSGSYVRGISNSSWPLSWDGTLEEALGTSLPQDPINKFAGCANPPDAKYDPNTCWNEINQKFKCSDNTPLYTYNYFYKNLLSTDYRIADNFEYDVLQPGFWAGNLILVSGQRGVENIEDPYGAKHLVSRLTPGFCGFMGHFGEPPTNSCGNHIMDPGEQCDGNYTEFACDTALGNQNWWNEHRIGCYPPGYRDSNGNLLQCRWFVPDPPLDAAACGGYCGDNTIQPNYERCEGNNFNNVYYSCPNNGAVACTGCQAVCPASGNILASACGDGHWDQGVEECDYSGNPDGLVNMSCTAGGVISCNAQCQRTCDVGMPSNFVCMNNLWEQAAGEPCDPTDWTPLPPAQSPITHPYTCSNVCTTTGQPYCGDGVQQSGFGENCDGVYTPPSPAQSSDSRQYECHSCQTNIAGGHCQDGILQPAYETCEPALYISPPPIVSREAKQYKCSNACLPNTGGWCGDGTTQNLNNEQCDPNGSDFQGWVCTDGQPILCNNDCTRRCNPPGLPTNAVCGNGIPEPGEDCDWASYPALVAPKDSSLAHQYKCKNIAPNACTFIEGYCGDNIINDGQALPGHGSDHGEICESGTYVAPAPKDSDANHRYQCGTAPNANACQPTSGGYCGSGQPPDAAFGETCDPNGFVAPAPAQAMDATHQYGCVAAPNADACKQVIGGWCGDNTVNGAQEECDNAAGLAGWSCPSGAPISCAVCVRDCPGAEIPVNVVCNNGILEAGEDCEPPANPRPGVTPQNSTIANQYVCGALATPTACKWENKYCGNSVAEMGYGEECDPNGYVGPTPQVSTIAFQYACGAVTTALACKDTGGYCGDNIKNGTEYCDGTSWVRTPATAINNANQYECSTAAADKCTVSIGGWCGDGIVQAIHNEQCDGTADCSPTCTYTCVADVNNYPSGVVSTANVTFGNYWYQNFDFNIDNNSAYFTPGWTNVIHGNVIPGINVIYNAAQGWGFDPAVNPDTFGIGGRTRTVGTTMTRDYLRRGGALGAGDPRGYPIFKIKVPANGAYGVTVYRGDTEDVTTFPTKMDVEESGITIGTVNAQVGLNVTKSTEMIANVNDGFLDLRLDTDPYCPLRNCNWGINGLEVRQIVPNTGNYVSLNNGQNSTINLPQCRVSGDVVTNAWIDSGSAGTTFAIIAVANSIQGQTCVADGNVGVGDVWNPPFANDCTQTNLNNPLISSDDHYGRPNDKTMIQAMQFSLSTILLNMHNADPTMDVAMIHYGAGDPTMGGACTWGCGVLGSDFSIVNDNLYYSFSQYLNIGAAIAPMVGWANNYHGAYINDPATGDYSDPSDMLSYAKVLFTQANPLYDNLMLVVLDSGKKLPGLDNTYIGEWNSGIEPAKIDDLKAMGVKVVTLDFYHFGTTGGNIWTRYEGVLNAVSSNNCVCGADTNFCYTPAGTCGNGVVDCGAQQGVKTAPLYWTPNPAWLDQPLNTEECDGQPGCGANCKWIDRSKARKFSVREDSSVATGWLLAPPVGVFSSASNLTSVEVNSGSGWTSISLPAVMPGWTNNIHLDTRSLYTGGMCDAVDPPNNLPFSVRFNAGASPNASILFNQGTVGGTYNYCHW